MSTWSFTEYLDGADYTPWTHSSWSQYSVVLIAGDTLSVRTIYNGSNSSAYQAAYVTSPGNSRTVNDPDPSPTTNNNNLLDKTWSTSGFTNTNHHSRWFFYTATASGPGIANGYAGIRILTIPSTMGWSGVQSNIEQGTAGNAVLTIPSSFESYIQGTASETSGDSALSTDGTVNERFHWRIVSSTTSNTAVSAGFSSSSGDFVGPSSGDYVSISPGFSTPAGTYYIKLYFYDYNGNTGTTATTIDTGSFNVTAAAPLDTSISLTNSTFTISETATSYSGNTMTGGGTNTIYYVLNVSNFTNGSNIDALRQNSDSRYIARTFSSSTGTRTFETNQNAGTIINDLPSTGTFDTYYLYAANGNGLNSTRLTTGSTEYTVGRADTSISLTPSTTSLTATSTSDVTVNVTGDTSGTQYRLYTNNIPRWVSTYNGGGSSSTDFTISYDEASSGGAGTGFTELPGLGQTYTYFSQARVPGHSAPWINTNDSFTVTRSAAATYSVSASPTSINEGQSTTWTVTTSNVVNNTSVTYSIGGINSQDLSSGSLSGTLYINSNTASTSITLQQDSATEGAETATLTLASPDSTGASTGSPSASVSIADTSTQGTASGSGGTISGGTSNAYGLSVSNLAGTSVIIDNTSRLGTFINTASITLSNTNVSGSLFTSSSNGGAVDCSNNTIIGIATIWTGTAWLHPTVTRNTSTNGLTITRLNSTDSDPNNFWGGTLTVSLIRY